MDSKNTKFRRPGRIEPVISGIGEDPINYLLNQFGQLAIPSRTDIKKRRLVDYDFLPLIPTRDRRRLAAAQITTAKFSGVSQHGRTKGLTPDLLLQAMQEFGVPGSDNMKPDQAAQWYIKQALAGLDVRQRVRQHPSFRKNLARLRHNTSAYRATYRQLQSDDFEAAELAKYEDEKLEFLKYSSDEYRESFTAQVFADDNFIGNNSYEYDLAQKMRAQAAIVSDIYDEANEASFKLAEEIEAGRRLIPKPLTFKMSGTQGEGLVSAYDTSLKVGQPAFIVDIDETLLTGTKKAGKIENRLLALKASRPVTSAEWYPWNQAAKQAKPIRQMIDFVKGLEEAGIQPVFMTARDEAMREFTTERLRKLGLNPQHLFMRGLSQEQADLSPTALKSGMLDEIGKRFNFLGVMDDSGSVVEMAFKRGVSFGMVPSKGGFDSIEASVQRGLEIAAKVGDDTVKRMVQSIEPIVSAGATFGAVSEETFGKILEAGKMSMTTLERIIQDRRLGEAVAKKLL